MSEYNPEDILYQTYYLDRLPSTQKKGNGDTKPLPEITGANPSAHAGTNEVNSQLRTQEAQSSAVGDATVVVSNGKRPSLK